MSKRLEGGFLTARPTWSTAATPGVWASEQHFARVYASGWPSPTALFDPYFESVSLLLHMDGSNGSTTFVDSSLGNLAVTANGNAQISTAQSKFGGSSGSFDGVGDFLQLSGQSGFAFGTGDFTIELWAYFNNFTNQVNIYESRQTAEANRPAIVVNTSAAVSYYDGSSFAINSSAGVLTTGQWFHIAVARSNGSTRLFVNGIQVGATYSDTLNYGIGANRPVIGTYNGADGNVNGYIDELRVTKGVARYTSNFTVPGAGSDEGAALYDPYFDYVSLLLRCNGENNSTTFTDSSNNALAITRNGDAKISTTQARFGGASAAFDGTGDYLSVPSTGMISGTEDFTIEWWQKLSNAATTYSLARFSTINSLSGIKVGGGTLQFYVEAVGAINIVGTASFTTEWQHCAICRRSSVVKMFVNGTELTLTTNTAPGYSFPSTVADIGRAWTGYGYVDLNGYIDDLRITKGVARYTTAFRPVGPYATSGKLVDPYLINTSLLLPMTGDNGTTSFFDRSNNFLRATENGNAKVSTTQSKFGGTSAYFDGTGDYLTFPSSAAFDFGTGDFTIEFWVNGTTLTGSDKNILTKRPTNSAFGAWLFFYNVASNAFLFYASSNGSAWDIASALTILSGAQANIWYHLAVTRSGSTIATFANGALVSTTTSAGSFLVNSAHNVSIGASGDGTSPFTGYIDDLRITKGAARYTSAFTPPERAFNDEAFNDPDYNNVSLLLHMDGANNSTTFTDSSVNGLTVTANGDAKISTAQSRFGGASAVFDGTGDYLAIPGSSMPLGSNDWTVEGWFYRNSTGRIDTLLRGDNGTTSGFGLDINFNLSNALVFGLDGTNTVVVSVPSGTHNIVSTTWYHIAFTRSGSTWRVFVNGVLVGTGTNASSITTPTTYRLGGNSFDGIYNWSGYIDEFRVTRGIARYTSNFTPPTLPFYNTTIPTVDPSFSSVSLLLHMNGTNGSTTFTDSSSNALAVTANGNAQISTAQSKFGGASAVFDGTGDTLSVPTGAQFDLGTGNFTVEAWVYATSLAVDRGIYYYGSANTNRFQMQVNSNGSLAGYIETSGVAASIVSSASIMPLNTWKHVTFTRDGTTLRLFVDGILAASLTSSVSAPAGQVPYVGYAVTASTSRYWQGYIDDFRITKGVARYTSNFYIPRAAFPDA